jgi:hypothetical protein
VELTEVNARDETYGVAVLHHLPQLKRPPA